MKSLIAKRSIVVAGHKTSVSLESPFWDALKEVAHEGNVSLSTLVTTIDQERGHGNLSSAIRLFVFAQYRPAVLPGSVKEPLGTDAKSGQRRQVY
jgi:predicted DNA-binding ribbon-helix-helix protein